MERRCYTPVVCRWIPVDVVKSHVGLNSTAYREEGQRRRCDVQEGDAAMEIGVLLLFFATVGCRDSQILSRPTRNNPETTLVLAASFMRGEVTKPRSREAEKPRCLVLEIGQACTMR